MISWHEIVASKRPVPSIGFILKNFKQIVDALILYSDNHPLWFRKIDLENAIIHDHLRI